MSKPAAGDAELLKTARERFDHAKTWEDKNRQAALTDLKFIKGDHWTKEEKEQRKKRPCITVNPFPTLIHQVTNDQRQNRPTINVSPVGDGSDVKVAQMLRDMIRAIQRNSDAEIAIDTAFQGAAGPGWGFWRITTEYESSDSFDQVLAWRRIRNPFSVYCDPSSQDPTTSDKKWCHIVEKLPLEDFKRKHPKASPVHWVDDGGWRGMDSWWDGKYVTISEYWTVETQTRELVALADGFIGFRDKLGPEVLARIEQDPGFVTDSRQSEVKTVKCRKISGREVLENYDWDDDIIPIVRVIGDELDIDGEVTLSGIVRHAIDSAKVRNFANSAQAERIGVSPKVPFVAAVGQIEGREAQWRTANSANHAVLLYNPIDVNGQVLPPPQRQPPISADPGIIAMIDGASQDLLGTTGIRFSAEKNERITDESGVALKQLRQNTDLGAYHYTDNLARALKVTGGIIIRQIPKRYDMKRIAMIVREDGTEDNVLIDINQQKPVVDGVEYNGKRYRSYNPSLGKYAVAVNIGPSFDTRRQEQSAGMFQFMQADPTAVPLIGDLVAKVQPWEGADEISRRLAMRLPPGTLQPDSVDLSPQAQALVGQMQQAIQQLSQERQQLIAALQEKDTEHQIDVMKINRDFEAKTQDTAAKMQIAGLDRITERLATVEQQALEWERLKQEHMRSMVQLAVKNNGTQQ